MLNFTYETPVLSELELISRIYAAGNVREMPDILQTIPQSLKGRCQSSVLENGLNSE